ncbi:MAG: 50S ribosomal protein L13 [Spirochaetes bacterium]|nr:MAG: 50S ribosomal protein L13 [Spirochaetota bacterium]
MSKLHKTYSMKEAEIQKKWFIVDAEGKILGRMATEIAIIIRGKHKPTYTPHLDMGDNVIVINADKIRLTGAKAQDNEYFSHSQYPGGKKFTNIQKILKEKPEFVVEHAIKGMLPKGKLGRKLFKNLKVYAGTGHPHAAQMPEVLELK